MNKNLWKYILLAMVAGISTGLFFYSVNASYDIQLLRQITQWLVLPGYFFIAMFKLLVVPLIVTSIIIAITGHTQPKSLTSIGISTLSVFLFTTVIAIIIGISMATFINPVSLIDEAMVPSLLSSASPPSINEALFDTSNLPKRIVSTLITANPFSTFVQGEMLKIVIFSVIVGISLLLVDSSRRTVITEPVAVIQEAAMALVNLVLKISPFAVFGLLLEFTADHGLTIIDILGGFIATVIGGLLLMLCMYAVLLLCIGKSPLFFFKGIRDAQLIAFSSSSSSVTLPVTISVARDNLGLSANVYRFVLPFGTIINMNGTALFQATATVFLASLYGIDLATNELLIIAVLTLAAAIGTPTVPSTGLITLATIVVAVGIPAEAILIIAGVDRLLDMCRTTINVTGDLFTAVMVERMYPGEKS